ncbi:MAG TPA: hypothetical protein VFS21_11390 [Roseiflexaceae bacterium]|nr:hypothetical protein [Roseiflexaceae bacterium]
MDCRLPPPLHDDDLSAVLDGAASAEVLEHLAACPACAARLEQASRFESSLHRRLGRWGCPDPQQLGEYQQGLLPAAQAQTVALHLDQCYACGQELAELQAFFADDEFAPAPAPAPARRSLRARLGELIATLLPAPAAPALALRGSITPRTLTAEAGDTTIMLEIQPAGADVLIQGQLLADALEPWEGALVQLHQSGALVAAAAVDEFGGFACGPLSPGPADLRITPQQGMTVVLSVEF